MLYFSLLCCWDGRKQGSSARCRHCGLDFCWRPCGQSGPYLYANRDTFWKVSWNHGSAWDTIWGGRRVMMSPQLSNSGKNPTASGSGSPTSSDFAETCWPFRIIIYRIGLYMSMELSLKPCMSRKNHSSAPSLRRVPKQSLRQQLEEARLNFYFSRPGLATPIIVLMKDSVCMMVGQTNASNSLWFASRDSSSVSGPATCLLMSILHTFAADACVRRRTRWQ